MTSRAVDTSAQAPAGNQPRIGIACNDETRRLYLHPGDLRRLERLGQVAVEQYDVISDWDVQEVPVVPEVEDQFVSFVADLDVLLLARGAPRVSERVLPQLQPAARTSLPP